MWTATKRHAAVPAILIHVALIAAGCAEPSAPLSSAVTATASEATPAPGTAPMRGTDPARVGSTVRVDPTLEMHYQVDDFTDPWTKPETILMVHGISESSDSWYAWVPVLARHYRVIRIDQRGFGRSSPVAEDYPYSTKANAQDIANFMDQLKLTKVHLVAAKSGGTVSLQFAHDYPDRLYSLTTVGSPAKLGSDGPARPTSPDDPAGDRLAGDTYWQSSMRNRLGTGASPELFEYWSKFMGSARLASVRAIGRWRVDLTPILAEIKTPTLMISASRSSMVPVQDAKAWTAAMPHGELLVMESDSYHLAATNPEQCAQATLEFIRKVERQGKPRTSAEMTAPRAAPEVGSAEARRRG